MSDQNNVDIVVRVQQLTQQAFSQIQAELKKIEGGAHDTAHEAEGLSHTIEGLIGAFGHFGEGGEKIASTLEGMSAKFTGLGESAGVLGPIALAGVAVTAAVVGVGLAAYEGAEKLHELIDEAIKSGTELVNLSHKTGLSVEALTELKAVSGETGIPVEALTNAMYKMEVGIGTGSSKVTTALADLGLQASQLKAMKPEEAFTLIIDKLKEVPDAARQAADGQAIFSKGWKEARGLLVDDVEEIVKTFHAMGGGMSQEMAVAARDVGNLEQQFHEAFESIATKVGGVFLPTIGAALTKLKEAWIEMVADSGVSAAEWSKRIQGVGVQVIQYMGAIALGIAAAADSAADFFAGTAIVSLQLWSYLGKTVEVIGKVQYALGDKDPSSLASGLIKSGQSMQDWAVSAAFSTLKVNTAVHGVTETFAGLAAKVATFTQGDMDAYNQHLDELVAKERKHQEALLGEGGALGKTEDALKSFLKTLEKLAQEVTTAESHGATAKDVYDQFGAELLKDSAKAQTLGIDIGKLSPALQQAMDDAKKFKLSELIAIDNQKIIQEYQKIQAEISKQIEAEGKRRRDATASENKQILDLQSQLDDLHAQHALSATDYQIYLVRKAADAQKAALDKTSADYQEAFDKIDEIVTLKTADIISKGAGSFKDWYQQWDDALGALSTGFDQLGKSATGAFAEIALAAGGVTGALKLALQAQKETGSRWGLGEKLANPDDYTTAENVQNYGQAGLGIAQGAQNVWSATDVQGRGHRAASGALAGMEAGAAFGPYGMAIGAAAGAIIGALRNPGFEQEMIRISKDFGTNISEQLARNIDKLQEDLFKGNRQAAEVFSLGDIMKEAGGLKASNIATFTDRLHDAFSMLQTGKFTVDQTQQVLEQNFGQFAAFVTKSKDLASTSFQQIVQMNHAMGVNAQAVQQFVESQTGVLGQSVAALAGPLAASISDFGTKFAAAQQQVATLTAQGKTDTGDYAKAVAALNDLQAQQGTLAAANTDEVARLGNIALASFNAAIAGGADYLTALNQMGPALDQLIGIQQTLGIDSHNAAIQELEDFRNRANANQSLVLGAQALGQTMRALTSIGGLNTQTLADMESQGLETFQRLEAAGFSDNESLQLMKDYLLNVIQAHQQLHEPIDANTQALIDQAQQAGILGKDTKSMTDILKDGFKQVADAINNVARGLGIDVPQAADQAADAINRIPRHIPISVDYSQTGATPDLGGNHDIPGAASGIYATGSRGVATWFGEGGEPELGGPVDFMSKVLSQAQARGGATGSVHVVIDARGAFMNRPQDLDRLADMTSDAVMRKLRLRQRQNAA